MRRRRPGIGAGESICSPMISIADYVQYDGLGLAALVRQKAVTPIELVEAAIAQIETHNPALNAVVHKMYDVARARAKTELGHGAFAGVPMLLKDLLAAYAGQPLQNGSRFFHGNIPEEDAEIVRRYKRAGLIVVGKTNTPEFGITGVTEPVCFGPTNNPWNLSRTAGGSSGGSAAAVAAGIVPVAHGGDGGGSIRIPAACCGLFGFKPTRGRTPSSTPFVIWQDFVVEHVLCRTVRDSAALLDATLGPALGAMNTPPPPSRPFLEEIGAPAGRLRVAVTDGSLLGKHIAPDCRRAVADTATLLEELGHDVIPAELDHLDWPAFAEAYVTMIASEIRADIDAAQRRHGRKAAFGEFEFVTRALSLIGGTNSGNDFVSAVRTMQSVGREIGRYFADNRVDVLLTSTLASPPVETGTILPTGLDAIALKMLSRFGLSSVMRLAGIPKKVAADSFEFTPNTTPFNLTGQPAMSVPLAWCDDGLPIGLQFVGRYADEATLFRLAAQLEEARPWSGRRPALPGA